MSETEHKVGTLVDTGKSFRDYLLTHNIPEYYDSEEEYFDDLEDTVLFEETVWEVELESNVSPEDDIFCASRNSDRSISYEVKYYNGGCGKREAIQTALKNMKGG